MVADGSSPPQLQRRFGLLQATALNMTNMIGVGPFITIPALMSCMHGPQAMLGWLVALVIALADGLVWSELGAALPGSGGSYVYLREGFGRHTVGKLMTFLFIWQFILSGPLEIASGFIGFKQYVKYLWPGLTPGAEAAVIVGVGLLAIALLYRRITSIGLITLSLWVGTLLTVAVVIVTGVGTFKPSVAFDFPSGAFDFSLGYLMGLGAASRIGIYDYLGYYDVCFLGDEVREPGRVIPRSILISLVAVALIYITMNLSIIGVVPWREFVPPLGKELPDPPPPVVSMFMERIYGTKAATIFTGLVLWTAFGSCFALLLGYSRVPYAAARDGNFFSIFGRLHPTKNFPHISLLLIGGLAIGFSFFPLSDVINGLLTTRILVQFIGQVWAVILLRRTQPNLVRPFRMWLFPVPALVALCGWLFLFITADRIHQEYAALVIVLGLVSYFVWARLTKRWPFAGPSRIFK
jgi:amino acid transporter